MAPYLFIVSRTDVVKEFFMLVLGASRAIVNMLGMSAVMQAG